MGQFICISCMCLVYVSCVQGNQIKFDNHWRDQLQWMGLFMVMWQMLKCMPQQLFVCTDKHNYKITVFKLSFLVNCCQDVDKDQCTEQLATCWPQALSDTQPSTPSSVLVVHKNTVSENVRYPFQQKPRLLFMRDILLPYLFPTFHVVTYEGTW